MLLKSNATATNAGELTIVEMLPWKNPVEFRCTALDPKRSAKWEQDIVCNKLLARIVPGTIMEIKCSRCGSLETSEHLSNNEENKTNE